MRLLNTETLKLETFYRDVPHYVILSHTWGEEEVTLDDIDSSSARDMLGWQKIARCCLKAKEDGFGYCWIDTCCINQNSSAELSEAINSMYKYYQRAEICYAHLSDVSIFGEARSLYKTFSLQFQSSRWFKRGWTLQELLAPETVEFYDCGWEFIGTKKGLVDILSRITRIDHDHLISLGAAQNASVAQKFRWVSLRQTKREEDIAYCIMGLVDVNMPLLYGEGASKAFIRLQTEIVKQTNEHSFLCWTYASCDNHASYHNYGAHGAFCSSPSGFKYAHNIRSVANAWHTACTKARLDPNVSSAGEAWTPARYTLTNRGLEIRLPCLPHPRKPHQYLAILNCTFTDRENSEDSLVAIWLQWNENNDEYYMLPELGPEIVRASKAAKATYRNICIVGEDEQKEVTRASTTSCTLAILSQPHSTVGDFKIRRSSALTTFSAIKPLRSDFQTLYKKHGYEVVNYACIGLFFDNGIHTFLLAFGLHDGQIWLQIVPDAVENNMRRALTEAFLAKDQDEGMMGRDTILQDIGNDFIVTAIARKKRDNSSILFWSIEVDIDAKAARPTREMAPLLRLSD